MARSDCWPRESSMMRCCVPCFTRCLRAHGSWFAIRAIKTLPWSRYGLGCVRRGGRGAPHCWRLFPTCCGLTQSWRLLIFTSLGIEAGLQHFCCNLKWNSRLVVEMFFGKSSTEVGAANNENWHHLLSNLWRQRSSCDRARYRACGVGPPGALYYLFATVPAHRSRRRHFLSRKAGVELCPF